MHHQPTTAPVGRLTLETPTGRLTLKRAHGVLFTREEHEKLVKAGAAMFKADAPITDPSGRLIPTGADIFAIPVVSINRRGLYLVPVGAEGSEGYNANVLTAGDTLPAGRVWQVLYSAQSFD